MHCLYKVVSRRAVLHGAVCTRWLVIGQYYWVHCLYKVVSRRAVLPDALSVQGGQS